MQRGEQKSEDDQQQNQMEDLADTLQNSPDESKETRKSRPDTHSLPPGRPAMTDDRQIFSSMRAALPDKSRR